MCTQILSLSISLKFSLQVLRRFSYCNNQLQRLQRVTVVSLYCIMVAVVLLKFIIVIHYVSSLQQCHGEVVYVTPNPPPNDHCPHGVPCHTLQYYFSNESFLEQSHNLTMIFMSGEHVGLCHKTTAIQSTSFRVIGIDEGVIIMCAILKLSCATAINFESVTIDHGIIVSPPQSSSLVFTMSSVIVQNQSSVYIEHARNVSENSMELYNCTFVNSSLSGSLYFSRSESDTLRGVMNILLCTVYIGESTDIIFESNRFRYATMYLNLSTLHIESTHMFCVHNQRAILTYKSTLKVTKSNMTFINNAAKNSGGGAWYVYNSTINVQSTLLTFINNSAILGGAIYSKSSNLSFGHGTQALFERNSAKGRKALTGTLCNVVFYTEGKDKMEGVGGAIRIAFSTLAVEHNSSFTFMNNIAPLQGGAIDAYYLASLIVNGASSLTFINSSAQYVAGALSLTISSFSASGDVMITFVNSQSDEGGALSASHNSIVNIENNTRVTFTDNLANMAGAIILISLSSLNIRSGADIVFLNNTAKSAGGAIYVMQSFITIGNGTNVQFITNNAESEGGGIFLLSSKLSLENETNITFLSNSAARGGAIAFSMSQMEFASSTPPYMIFDNNSALEFGGAIYSNPDRLQHLQEYINYANCTYAPCLYYNPHGKSSNSTEHSLYFRNNSAKFGGDDVNGASLKLCNGSFAQIKNTGLSHVSGYPTRVCKCTENNYPECHDQSYTHISQDIFPSQTFSISVAIVGGDWGTTTGIVYAKFAHPYYDHTGSILKPSSQYTQEVNSTQCSELHYNVYSNHSVELILSVDQNLPRRHYLYCKDGGNFTKDSCKYFSPLYIHLNTLPCPPGFSLQDDPPGCDCNPVLSDNGIECSVEKGKSKFSWSTDLWMNVTTNYTVYSENCPFSYCKESKTIKKYNFDDQCAYNHAGRLCGSCRVNYNLAIGSSRCIYCPDNSGLALLIFFAAAGFLLVLFIGILNLTVADGMINGFIFYANLVWKFQSILFPEKMHNRLFFLKTFVAWLNLDFGIETCFLKGLNTFWKTWLQFVFPLYIWSIAGLIIVMARHSTRATKLLGNRAVPILATLFLLSYTKLLKTTVDILDFSVLTVYQPLANTTSAVLTVWSVDGTLEYFTYPHILLFVAALLVLLFLWLPYTLLLLLIQWLRRMSHLWILKWTLRFNPFYDAYFAPLKPRHQYWFGVLLLARGILFITFASNFAIPQDINLLILLSSAAGLLFLMFVRSVHKSPSVMAFEGTFLLNLSLLSGSMIFAHSKRKHKHTVQAFAVGLSSGVVFVQFCCLIIHRIYSICRSYKSLRNVHAQGGQVNEEQDQAILDIGARPKRIDEIQPLLAPNVSDSDNDDRVTPTY